MADPDEALIASRVASGTTLKTRTIPPDPITGIGGMGLLASAWTEVDHGSE